MTKSLKREFLRHPPPRRFGLRPEVAAALESERVRQNEGLELIASENFVQPGGARRHGLGDDQQVRRGLPGRRYYGGCEFVDIGEELAIKRAKQLFGATTPTSSPTPAPRQHVGLPGA